VGHDDDGLGDQINMIFKGCTVVNGRGRAVVTATGMNTEMGQQVHFHLLVLTLLRAFEKLE
jgi:magnesium-transporting ATPase (P-type)